MDETLPASPSRVVEASTGSPVSVANSVAAAAAIAGGAPKHRDKLTMVIATATRMGVGLVTFILLARYLGPSQFGIIATAIAYCTFVGIITDFGLSIYTLRSAAMAPDDAARIVRNALAVKLSLSLLAAIVGIVVLFAVVATTRIPVYALAFVGAAAYSAGDLSLIVLRAHRRFADEAKLVVATSVMLMLGVGGTAALTHDVTAAAIAFAVTRLLYLAIILFSLRRSLAVVGSAESLLQRVIDTLGRARGFAADAILTSLSGQIDVLLFGLLLSAHDRGIYQAGSRLVQVIMPFAAVLSTVYMPALAFAAGRDDRVGFRSSAQRLNLEFTGLAIFGGLAFALLGPRLTVLLYGNRYEALIPLWAGFGAFAMLRFSSAAYGIQLAALGHIRTRITAQLIAMTVFAALTMRLLPRQGLPVTSEILALSSMPTLLMLAGALFRDGRSGPSLPWTVASTLAVTIALLLWR